METTENKAEVFNKQVFLDRIQFLIDHHCGGSRKKFNQIVQQRGAEYRWRKAEYFPKVEPLVRICNHFGVSLDWLLGRDPGIMPFGSDDGNFPSDDGHTLEIINHYKEIAEHWKNLYKHLCSIVSAMKADPCQGVTVKAQQAS